MNININVTFGGNAEPPEPTMRELAAKLDSIATRLGRIETKEDAMNPALQAILDKLTAQTTVIGSVKTLIEELRANQSDPAVLKQILDAASNNTDILTNALVANTPVTPAAAAATV